MRMSTRDDALPSTPRRRWHRGALNDYIAEHTAIWEGTAAILAGVYLVVGVLADAGDGVSPYLLAVLGVIFLIEFFARLIDSRSRSLYIRRHWLDFVSCLPLIGGLRAFRLVRLLRLGAAARVLALAEAEASERNLDRSSLWFMVPTLLVIWFAAAAVYWTLESGNNPAVHHFGDALFWVFITVTTVGYGDVANNTPETRILSGILIFTSIGFVGFASNRLAARLLRHPHTDTEINNRLNLMERQLDEIVALLSSRTAAPRPATRERTQHPSKRGDPR